MACVFCVFFYLLRGTLPLNPGARSLSYYVRQSMQVVEGLPSSNIWAMLPSSKGASGNGASRTGTSVSGLRIWCSDSQGVFEDIVVADGQFRHFSEVWVRRHTHTFCEACSKVFIAFSEENVSVMGQRGPQDKMLLKCGVRVPLFQ